MIIRATQHRQLTRDGVATDYVAAQELPEGKLAAQARDSVDILSAKGEVLLTSPGQNLETNIAGDVFWTEDGNISKWTAEKGETTFAKGYNRFLPGPDGKVFALGYAHDAGDVGLPTVDLLDADGKLVSREFLPERFNVTGAYLSHDEGTALLGGWSDKSFDSYTRPASVFSLEVGGDGKLKMRAEHQKDLNALTTKDCQPLLLEDGRIGVAEQGQFHVAGRQADQAHVWDILGPFAAAGGRPVDVGSTVAPAATLDEQLEAIYPTPSKPYERAPRAEGTPIWSQKVLPEGGLVDLNPAPAPEPLAQQLKSQNAVASANTFRSTILPLGAGGLGLGAAAILVAAGQGPVGLGVGLAGLASAGVLKLVGDHRTEYFDPQPPVPPVPRLTDPKLGERLKDSLGLSQAPEQTFAAAKVTSQDDQTVVEFSTGMVMTKKGEGESLELHLFSPTGDEKKLSAPKTFSFNAETAELAVDGATYNLDNSTIAGSWIKVDKGTLSSDDESKPAYLGNGVFQNGKDDGRILKLPLPPEVFSDSVGYAKAHASGEVFTKPETVIGPCVSFKSVERLDSLKAPEYSADGSLKNQEAQLLSSSYRVTLKDGRVLTGNETGVSLGSNPLRNTKLLVGKSSITLRKEQFGKYLVDKPVDGFWNQVGDILTPGSRKYERVEGGTQVVKQQDLTIASDGGVTLTESLREQPLQSSPLKETSRSVARVGDPQIGENFEHVI